MIKNTSWLLIIPLFIFITACQTSTTQNEAQTPPETPNPNKNINVPVFSADSAYAYTKTQVDFGPRTPGSKAHKQCADWLIATMQRLADTVYVQKASVTNYANKQLPIYNIIGSFNPQAKDRILLCSHWDSRPRADQDTTRKDEPILGADDGGSSTAVALEIARLLKNTPVNIGIDIVLFDAEDDGIEGPNNENTYCLGTQYWGKNLHVPGYNARYGILLDMVGAADATFLKEQNSMKVAPQVVDMVWNTAAELGYSSMFIADTDFSPSITDDHIFVYNLAHIPTIDIINYVPYRGFGRHWHTHKDNMDIISKNTLAAVGHVVSTVIYRENANAPK